MTELLPPKTAKEVLDFWFSEEVKPLWFKKSLEFDRKIYHNFFSTYELAAVNQLKDWQKTAEGTLALAIVLDQFPRNMFRNLARAFATDHLARELARFALQQNYDTVLSAEERVFLYIPFMHSENIEDQQLAVKLYRNLGKENNLQYAIQHKEIIERFGRFPHRNVVLKRNSTEEEILFLAQPGSSF
jgi:uncharacterized protein (DUF924 family)